MLSDFFFFSSCRYLFQNISQHSQTNEQIWKYDRLYISRSVGLSGVFKNPKLNRYLPDVQDILQNCSTGEEVSELVPLSYEPLTYHLVHLPLRRFDKAALACATVFSLKWKFRKYCLENRLKIQKFLCVI